MCSALRSGDDGSCEGVRVGARSHMEGRYPLRHALGVSATAFLALVLAGAVTAPRRADAAFPTRNGKIAFGSNRDGNFEIYVMNPDGSGQVNLSNSPADDREPAWSPNGQQIAFTSTRDGNDEIYKMNADGTGQTRLTTDPLRDRNPAWTSDGRIVFDRGAVAPSQCEGLTDLYIMNADGTGVRNLTDNPAAEDCVASGSATGRIAFSSNRGGNILDIYAINPDGGGLVRLTNNPGCGLHPNWAPSSTRIVFSRDATSNCMGDNDLYVMQADGTGQTRLTDTPSRIEFYPAWSPQEDRIAFEGCPSSTWPNCASQIYAISPTGGGEVQLTFAGSNRKPDWQPLAKLDQTIAFDAPAAKTYGDPDFTVSASASSGLPVSFTATGSCTVSGTTVHLTGAGSCTLTASQPGDATYNAATDVSRTFSIARTPCTVPKVVGKKLAAAKLVIARRHCRTGKVSSAYSSKRKKGTVAAQSRRAGQVLPAGSKISLVVSRGPRR